MYMYIDKIVLRHRPRQVGGNKTVELGAVNDMKKSGLKGMDGWPYFIFARSGSMARRVKCSIAGEEYSYVPYNY